MAVSKAKPLDPGEDGIVRRSGGNPQIAKAEGGAPVQAYIVAMPRPDSFEELEQPARHSA